MQVKIADLSISIPYFQGQTPDAYDEFFTSNAQADLRLVHNCGKIPGFPMDEAIFDSNGLWSSYKSSKRFIYKSAPLKRKRYDQIISIEPDFKTGTIYSKNQHSSSFKYPLDEMIFINLFARNKTLLLHSCGIDKQGKGLLFVGVSTAGKSTLANLWNKRQNVTVLNDDRIAVRKIKKRFYIYGTPWHGDAKLYSPKKVLLEKIFFLHKAKNNFIQELKPGEIASGLMACSFLNFGSRQEVEAVLKLCTYLAQTMPAYRLGFLPDSSVLEFIETII